MTSGKDYHRGFDDAMLGKPPPITGSFAEWQGHQAGQQAHQQQRDAQARPVAYTRITLPLWLERGLQVLGIALAVIGFAFGAWVSFRMARGLGSSLAAALAWSAFGGLIGASAGVVLPRFLMGAALVVWALAVFAVLVAIVLAAMRFGGSLLR